MNQSIALRAERCVGGISSIRSRYPDLPCRIKFQKVGVEDQSKFFLQRTSTSNYEFCTQKMEITFLHNRQSYIKSSVHALLTCKRHFHGNSQA